MADSSAHVTTHHDIHAPAAERGEQEHQRLHGTVARHEPADMAALEPEREYREREAHRESEEQPPPVIETPDSLQRGLLMVRRDVCVRAVQQGGASCRGLPDGRGELGM